MLLCVSDLKNQLIGMVHQAAAVIIVLSIVSSRRIYGWSDSSTIILLIIYDSSTIILLTSSYHSLLPARPASGLAGMVWDVTMTYIRALIHQRNDALCIKLSTLARGSKRECNPFSCHVITNKSPSHCERKHHLESLSELLRLPHIENILFIPFRVMRRVRMQPF